jgi:hypothetical protein
VVYEGLHGLGAVVSASQKSPVRSIMVLLRYDVLSRTCGLKVLLKKAVE